MKLISVHVLGFQSFSDSGEIEFADGINLIVGQNNAGKSALLRAMQPNLPDDRHRTPNKWEDYRLGPPDIRLVIEISGAELRTMLLQTPEAFIPTPLGEDINLFMTRVLSLPLIRMSVHHTPRQRFKALSYPGHGQFVWDRARQQACALAMPNSGDLQISQHLRGDDSTPEIVHKLWERQMFYFSAERMNIGQASADNMQRLSPNANNLPSVLLTLNGDRGDLFRKLVRHLREVFSTVGNLSVRPAASGTVEIRVWPTEAMAHVELSFPLMQSGTGVSQVISILTAVMTVENAVIIIDEINSFLHPAAVKALLRILQTEYAHHQYIISTHAPEVIGFSNPRTVNLVKRHGYESTVTRLSLTEVDAFRAVAEHLGVSMADVFAADRVVWVEGPTEELCFPLLYQQATGQPLPRGTVFTSVMATGDFLAKRRDKELVYQIYQRLSQVAVPLVISVAFSFDSENLTDAEKKKMIYDSRGAMYFLPRRMIECYLVNAKAISTFVMGRDHELERIDSDTVLTKLAELAGADKFKIAEWCGDLADPVWLTKVDAANLIADACALLSDQRVTFNKKDDTLVLLQQVHAIAPAELSELAIYVRGLVDAVSSS